MKHLASILLGSMLVLACSGTKNYSEQDQKAYQNLQNLVNDKQMVIKSNRARPMATNALMQVANTNILGPGNSASNIDISSNSNGLEIKGDSIKGFFPYYGEQQFGGSYPGANHQGIEFNDIPEDYSVEFDDAKHRAEIKFKIRDEYRTNETYNVYITLFPNNNSNVRVQSSNRTPIEFTGYVKRYIEEKEQI